MKKLAIAAAVSMALTSSAAQAADWTGWYAGAQLGYGDVGSNLSGFGGTGGFLGFTADMTTISVRP